jgi:hypothetical protein
MSDRFIIVDEDSPEAKAAGHEFYDDGWGSPGSLLLDRIKNEVVFCDAYMEPEDASLGRDLGKFVDKLNEVAAGG